MQILRNKYIAGAIRAMLILLLSCNITPSEGENTTISETSSKQKIMLSLLLDTSNSMDGLIDQAKSQLWTIVNELATAKGEDNVKPDINIALFEYGNSGLPSSEGYIRMVAPLTDDLDEISEKLFGLTTNGGDEFCGQVIQRSTNQLDWSASKADLKMIFIAGNEPFTQGNVSYDVACHLAKEKDIVVNTIFCGNYNEGVNSSWRAGALITGGSYMSIEQNKKTVFIKTPYDDKIDKLNDALNDTYIYYGTQGMLKKEKQIRQDKNAASYGSANKVKRAISKSSHAYKNSSWDLVDAAEDEEFVIAEVEEESLPQEMKGLNTAERKAFVKAKAEKRKKIQKEIQELSVKRKQFIADNQSQEAKEGMLDAVMIKSIKDMARKKNLTFE